MMPNKKPPVSGAAFKSSKPDFTQHDAIEQFRAALVGRGIIPPDSIIADGEIHRCGTEGKPNGDDGAYKLHLDGLPAGGFQNWSDGLPWEDWHADVGRAVSPAEAAANQERIKAAQAKRRADEALRQQAAREEACLIWAEAVSAQNHPYLEKKGVAAHGARLIQDNVVRKHAALSKEMVGSLLVIPMRDADGALCSLQFINEDGTKRPLPGGKKRGCYCPIGKPDGVLYVAEGFATGASIHEATGYAVAVAFDAGNLKPVALALRAKYPNAQIVVCADDDKDNPNGNIGLDKATEAAQAAGGVVAVPVFGEDRGAKDTDFNDMMALRGADAVKAVIDAALAGQAADEPSEQAPAQATPAKARNPRKPHRFVVDDGGVFFVEDGNSTWIASPLHVVAKTRDTKSNSWGRLLRWKDGDGVPHEWAMPIELLHGDGAEVWQELMRQGLAIASGRRSRNLLSSYLQTCPVEARARCVDRLGWHGTAYVTPDGQIGGDEHVVFQNAQHIEPAFSVSGTLDEWRGAVATMAEGNARTVFSISLAFAGSLAHLAGVDSGGFHLRGNSASGKTVSQMAASSVWGHPKTYKRSWRATANGLEGLALLHNDGALILDEIKECTSGEIGDIAYMLANGQGKCRANRNGAARQSATWRLLFLSSGELGLVEMMAQAGKRADAGQEIRLAEIPADAGMNMGAFENIHGRKNPHDFAEELEANACKHYGAAGPEWLRCIVQDVTTLPGTLNNGIRDFVGEVVPAGASGQIYRVARRFALVAAAGELASHYGLTGWREGESDTAAKKCFAAWFEAFGGAGNKEEQNILSQVKLFFETHGSSRFEAMNATTEQNVINRVGYWRDKLDHDERGNETTRREFLVTTEAFRHVICKGQDVALVTKVLVQKGWIAPGGDGRPTQKLRGVPRCYVFTDRMFEDES